MLSEDIKKLADTALHEHMSATCPLIVIGLVGNNLFGWLEFNVPFQHKYDYIRDD